MSEEIISLKNVHKFDGTNFLAWKFQMNAVFVSCGLSEVVSGTNIKPEEGKVNERKAWIKQDAKAMYIIASSIEAKELDSLLTCSSANEMWTTLSSIHEQKSASSKLHLSQKFHQYKMATNDSVVQHVAKVQIMARQLKDVGESVSDVAIMAKILGSLPSKFSSLVTAWDSVSEESQTIANLQLRLLKEEARLNAEDEVATALAAVSIKDNASVKKKSGQNQGEKSGKSWKSRSGVECFYCKGRGHFAKQCRKKKRDEESEKGSKEKGGKESDKCAFVATATVGQVSSAPSVGESAKLLNTGPSDAWLLDSGASRHITHRRDWFCEYTPNTSESIVLGDDGECQAYGSGTINIERLIDGQWYEATIENVLYVPRFQKNLFSLGVCAKQGFEVKFSGESVNITRDGKTKAQGVLLGNNIYRLFIRAKPKCLRSDANVSIVSLQQLHERLGHVNHRNLKEMVKHERVTGVKLSNEQDDFCEACKLGKAHRLPFEQLEGLRSSKPGEFVHSDVCGAFSVPSIGGARYFVVFKDDFTGFRTVYYLKHKGDLFERFKEYDMMISNKFGLKMRKFRSDNGREYINGEMQRYLASRGIVMENTAPHTPQQNGKAERENRTIVESARTMLLSRNLPRHLWAEAINTAVYTLNRTTSSVNPDTTPYTLWMGKKPNVSHLRVFGADAYAHVDKIFRKKLDSKAKKLVLVGYQAESPNYRLYDPSTKKIIISRDVFFNEKAPSSKKVDSESSEARLETNEIVGAEAEAEGISIIVDDHENAAENQPDLPAEEIQVPQQVPQAVAQQRDHEHQLRDRSTLQRPARYLEANVVELDAPINFKEATTGPDAVHWLQAIQSELEAHDKNRTWEVVPRDTKKKMIDSKWVFKVIRGCEGEVKRHKARLCARGFLQTPGQDYFETFAPVVRYDSLRVLLSVVAEKDLELVQFDIKTAFLHGELQEEVFMKVPEGLNVNSEKYVCKLVKSLYGLKQSPRCWNKCLCDFLNKFNFKPSEADKCIFHSIVNSFDVYLAVYVDDGLITSKSQEVLDLIVKALQKSFEITLGDTKVFVGMQIERDRTNRSVIIHQKSYVEKIVEKFNMTNAIALSIPADPHTVLYPVEDDEKRINVPFREAVGSLLFVSVVSRPDIAFAVNNVSKFVNSHDKSHWEAVKRIFRYLIGTADLGIEYKSRGGHSELIGFTDADYAMDLETRRSKTGYAFFMSGGIVTWLSERQKCVSLSTAESEYIAGASGAKEAVWLRKLLSDIGDPCAGPTQLFIDNESAIKLVKNPEFHKRTKHIDVRYHYIREKCEEGEIVVKHVATDCQRADIFTKALPKDKFQTLRSYLGLVSLLKQGEC